MNKEIIAAIQAERDHQRSKYGADKQQSLPGYLLIIERELAEAKEGWAKGIDNGRHSPMAEIVQIAATCIAAIETYGTEGNAVSTNDIPFRIGDRCVN